MNSVDSLPRRVDNYRESCDNCAKSKVRCGKEQPWCQRCVRRNQICSYSPSQRSRKRTLSATNTEGDRRTGMLAFSSAGNSASSTNKQDSNSILAHTDVGWGSCPDLVELLTRTSSSDSLTPDNANLAWMPEIESASGEGDMGNSLDRANTFMLPTNSGITTSSSIDMDGSGAASIDHMALRLMSSAMNQQHCEADIISTLVKLDLPALSCRGESRFSQNLGTILTASRSALSCATKTVSCTCSPNTNIALLVTALLLRILSWYDIVLRNCQGSGEGTNSSGNSNSSAAATDSFSSPAGSLENDEMDRPSTRERDTETLADGTDGSSLFVPPMTIGPYELDAENRERIIGQIVLSELGKMGRLLSTFSKKFCDPHSIALGGDNGSQLYLTLEMFLRNKHSVTVLAARERLEVK
ncbi:hypothetical protein FZEAL_9671 [Fusarium zealandicum]|uniref:Zn(2)-C6 fungal-type domain-containing protein n=1 Tax=Fusarium zealandicum TaxID=1053134 RepID=A0A8H4XEE4_9HYPO|nr:hypothetical protein FZEAL_9671 [Fusarium zealandicum]